MIESRWRLYARPIIAHVLEETQGQSEANIRKALKNAYPFGERAMYPYTVWRSEIKNQRFGKQPRHVRESVDAQRSNGQISIFDVTENTDGD